MSFPAPDIVVRHSELPNSAGSVDRWLGSLLRHSPDLVIATNSFGRVRFVSPSVEHVLGWLGSEFAAFAPFELVHPDDVARTQGALAQCLANPAVPVSVAFRCRRKDGTYCHLEGVGVNRLNELDVRAIVVAARDVTERTLRDPETGCGTRWLLLDELDSALRESKRGRTAAVLTIGIDRLFSYEESLPPEQFKLLITRIAAQVRAAGTTEDVVAHLGGNIFALLARGVSGVDGARTVALRIRRTLSDPIPCGAVEVQISAGIGIALGSEIDGAEQTLHDSEVALARAMRGGPSGTCVFDPTERETARNRLSVEAELRAALERREIIPHYQPIVRLSDRSTRGFEALARWRKADDSLVSPGVFIPVAEAAGLIEAVDLAILREACGQLAEWRRRDPNVFVSVNLSAHHFRNFRIVDLVEGILEETGAPAQAVKLELTETALVENADMAAEAMRALRSRGLQFGLDDFGTGYSSLAYLRRFPFDTLKIDRSFVLDLGEKDSNPALVAAILSLARALGMHVVAEGIERPAQLEVLSALDCDYVQGFAFSRPVDANRAGELIGSRFP